MKYTCILLTFLTLTSCEDEVPVDPFAISEKTRDSIYLKVQELYVGTKYLEAEKLLGMIRARDIYDHNYFIYNAKVKFNLQKYADAIHFINLALKVSNQVTNIAALHFIRASSYSGLNLMDSSLTSLNKAIELDSSNTGYISARVRIYESMNLPTLQYDDINHLIRIDSNKIDYKIALYELKFNVGDTAGAIVGCDNLVKKHPDNVLVLYKRGELAFAIGKKKEAKKYFQKCIDIEPTHGEVFFYMASILSDEKKKDKACDCLLKAVDLGNEDALVHIFKCEDYLKKKGINIQIKKDTLNKTTTVQKTTAI